MPNWTLRDISRDAAAAALKIPVSTLDVWLHRYRAPSGKRKGNRVFSLQDLTILQTARHLLSPGILAADALRIAAANITGPPDDDSVLFVTADRAWIGHRDDAWPPEGCALVTPGWIRKSLEKALENQNVV